MKSKRKKEPIPFVSDFETSVYEGQQSTEVWAAACVRMYTEDVKIFASIDEHFEYLRNIGTDAVTYFHNLKFDGEFYLSFLLTKLKYAQAWTGSYEEGTLSFVRDEDMPPRSFKYSISSSGQWYQITIRTDKNYIFIKDSLKLLPFSVKKIGKDFKTRHQKLEIEYEGERHAHGVITEQERQYIANDVLVVKEALEIMYGQGHKKLTIGACCLSEFKSEYPKPVYDSMHPDLFAMTLPERFGSPNVGAYIRRAYKGGWCYVVPGRRRKRIKNGLTLDVNSLYPSMMHSISGNKYPVGDPVYWEGNYIPTFPDPAKVYYFVRVRTRFYLKSGKLPTIQIKGNLNYNPREWLTTSDVYDVKNKRYYRFVPDLEGHSVPTTVEMVLTETDYRLMLDHYDLEDFEIIDGMYFAAELGIYDHYIDKYKTLKMTSTGAIRQLAKLFLNNLYGKEAASPDSSFKIAQVSEDGSLHYIDLEEYDKIPGYIACGAAITSYARNFTIRTAQLNYHGADQPGFIYADTDSLHMDIPLEEVKGVTIHPAEFCCWKLECKWDFARFVRAKTYLEHVVECDGEKVEPYFVVKCAGMPETCKKLFLESFTPKSEAEIAQMRKEGKRSEEEIQFLEVTRTPEDFDIGLVVPGKLMPRRIPGGVVLRSTTFEMLPQSLDKKG